MNGMLGRILLLCLLVPAVSLFAQATYRHSITSSSGQNLAALSTRLAANADSGVHVVRFSSYSNVGTFRIDGAPRIETLIFERDSTLESDSVLDVPAGMPLFEIKRMSGTTVIFRGLAFRLTSPSSILLAGWEPGRENLNLILDSCFVFGDSIASSFLNWNTTASGKVELRRTFFSARAGNPQLAKIFLTAGSVALHNNVLSFPGNVHAEILGGRFDALSNTANRTQFKLDGVPQNGIAPSYTFTRNFIAHAPSSDAFGQPLKYVLHAGLGFDAFPTVSHNRLYRPGWEGFDHPANPDPLAFTSTINNIEIDTVPGKARDEMWNWYQPDTTIGFAGGNGRRPHPFNVWPGEGSAAITFEYNPGFVYFRPAPFPRRMPGRDELRVVQDRVDSLPPDIRVHTPDSGAIRFGAFQVDSLVMPTFANYGRPVLLAAEHGGAYRAQRLGTGTSNQTRNVFVNDSPNARRFFLGFKGNTPRGTNVAPAGLSLRAGEFLTYSKVDTAGETMLVEEVPSSVILPDSLRALGNLMTVTTTAAVGGAGATMRFGFETRISPHLPGRVSSLNVETGELSSLLAIDGGNYPATVPASRSLKTILVERLNVKRGGTTMYRLGDSGSVQATSVEGFQLVIDSARPVDSTLYGPRAKAFPLTWYGRGPGDRIDVKLPAGPDHALFMITGDTIKPVADPVRDSGFFSFYLTPQENGRAFFSAIPFNVIGGRQFDDSVGSVWVRQLESATSGKLDFLPLDQSRLEKNPGDPEVLPSYARVLGGRDVKALFLEPAANTYSVLLPVIKAGIPANVAAFAFDGSAWRKLGEPAYHADSLKAEVFDLRIGDRAFVILEVLADPDNYVQDSVELDPAGRKITVSTRYRDDAIQPIEFFSLAVTTVDETGGTATKTSGQIPIGGLATVDLSQSSGLHSYSVQYYIDSATPTSLTLPTPEPITAFSWIPEMLKVTEPDKRKGQWYAVGFPGVLPFNLSFGDPPGADSSVRRILRLANHPDGSARWDTLATSGGIVSSPGSGYLVAANFPQTQRVDASLQLKPPLPYDVALLPGDSGWRLVSTPFPITFDAGAIKSSTGLKPFLALTANRDDSVRAYTWAEAGVLRPWEAYAYHFDPGETLTFDPWQSRVPAPVAAKAAAPAATPGGVEVQLEAGTERHSMRLLSGPGARSLPHLPAPGRGLDLRVGGKGGYFWKAVGSLRGIDEPVLIASPAARMVRLRVGPAGEPLPGGWSVRLLDLNTGKVLEQDALDAFELPAGTSEFRLLAGDPAFVEERVRGFQAGLPSVIALSQNFPNPFRHTTRIALDWPALAGSGEGAAGRKARLDIFDARGRQIQRIDLGKVKPGRQVLHLDASRWEAGVYTYRLTVETGKGLRRLQKRMLVTR